MAAAALRTPWMDTCFWDYQRRRGDTPPPLPYVSVPIVRVRRGGCARIAFDCVPKKAPRGCLPTMTAHVNSCLHRECPVPCVVCDTRVFVDLSDMLKWAPASTTGFVCDIVLKANQRAIGVIAVCVVFDPTAPSALLTPAPTIAADDGCL